LFTDSINGDYGGRRGLSQLFGVTSFFWFRSSKRELLALNEIHLTGQASDDGLTRKFLEEEMIVDIENASLLLTHKGRSLLVRGSPYLWDIVA
jgi:hypothetical protein